MKIRGRILALAITPLIVLGVVLMIFCSSKISSICSEDTETGLHAACVALRDNLTTLPGDYYLDGDILYKGDFNITDSTYLADNVKSGTNYDMTVFFGDTRYMTSVTGADGKRVLYTQAGEGVINTVLKGGKEYFSDNVSVVGQPYYGYYVPLYDSNKAIVGMVFAGAPQARVKSEINSAVLFIAGVLLIIIAIAAVALIILVGRITGAIQEGAAVLDEVATGNLKADISDTLLARSDEVGDMSRSIGSLKGELSKIVREITDISDEVGVSSTDLNAKGEDTSAHMKQVDRAVSEIAEGAYNQAEETQKCTSNVIEMGNMIEDNAEDIRSLNENAKAIKARGEKAVAALKELETTNDRTKSSIDVIYEQTNTTNTSAQQIKEATALITSIAEETNLLSLNASIEAARAGESGRGFAVVASQISKLAEQSNESAQQIEEIITNLLRESGKSVETMNGVMETMNEQSTQLTNTSAEVIKVIEEVDNALVAIDNVASKTQELNSARQKVVDTIQNLSAIAEENASSSEETASSANEVSVIVEDIANQAKSLNNNSADLKRSVSFFKL